MAQFAELEWHLLQHCRLMSGAAVDGNVVAGRRCFQALLSVCHRLPAEATDVVLRLLSSLLRRYF